MIHAWLSKLDLKKYYYYYYCSGLFCHVTFYILLKNLKLVIITFIIVILYYRYLYNYFIVAKLVCDFSSELPSLAIDCKLVVYNYIYINIMYIL